MRLLPIIFAMMSVAPAIGQQPALEQGQAAAEAFVSGALPELWDDMSASMQEVFGGLAGLEQFQIGVTTSFGEELEVLSENVAPSGALSVYTRVSRWSLSETPLIIQLAIAPEGEIDGFLVQPEPQLAESEYLDYETKAELSLPFKGEWFVVWGGRTLEANYHAANREQRFAMDALIMRDGKTHAGEASVLENYYCWDEPILSPGKGTLVAVVSDLPDNPIGETDAANPAGNHVVIDLGNSEFAFLGHMREGSISLEVGDEVTTGQELGRCGNSGNTSEPHLHLHLQTTTDLTDGEGLPAFFVNYTADGKPVERGEPQAGQFVSGAFDRP
ncbi:M23 family metallopeptidase [Devosia sp. SD17-2]|uniref:M23 family metallopeptidase n=1 Tax=Devosia sp. SD17-2 TaxID=2976459 RepID=UPI0023D80EB2|nr:M23 family metallopeptidase [Devosia sp. SD17-2]WEJ34170.1 M23 family metallopeptidase [Devosia sp. SD17-2]